MARCEDCIHVKACSDMFREITGDSLNPHETCEHFEFVKKDKEAIQRMLGRIEGVAMIIDHNHRDVILDALGTINSILDTEENKDENQN